MAEEEEELEEIDVENQNVGSHSKGKEVLDTDELFEFRQQWRAELKGNEGDLTRAEELYWMGVSAEQSGDVVSALCHYRHAVQLVPDIEQQVSQSSASEHSTNQLSLSDVTSDNNLDYITQNFFGLKIDGDDPLCTPLTRTKSTHVSSLPLEIFQYILCLVVLHDLDLRSLEQFGMVCKGFYMLSRESFIWKKACVRLWGDGCNPLEYSNNWRYMFITRPHVHFNGVYISKSSYVRNGEHSLDSLYKPFHLVVYYRYLRFHPDGTVIYLTSPQEPLNVIGQLKHKVRREGMMTGHYTQQANNKICITVARCNEPSPTKSYGRVKRQRAAENERSEELLMELEVSNSSRKLSSQLLWKKFSCRYIHKTTEHVQESDFNIDYTYASFSFSRVKSYSIIEYMHQ